MFLVASRFSMDFEALYSQAVWPVVSYRLQECLDIFVVMEKYKINLCLVIITNVLL